MGNMCDIISLPTSFIHIKPLMGVVLPVIPIHKIGISNVGDFNLRAVLTFSKFPLVQSRYSERSLR